MALRKLIGRAITIGLILIFVVAHNLATQQSWLNAKGKEGATFEAVEGNFVVVTNNSPSVKKMDVLQMEKRISYWAHPHAKKAFVWGSRSFLKLYLPIIADTLRSTGFQVTSKMPVANANSALSLSFVKSAKAGSWMCLALRSLQCVHDLSAFASLPDHVPFNRLPFLKLLCRKERFCKIVQAALTLFPQLEQYCISCWVFPEEDFTSLLEYKAQHPSISFISKPYNGSSGSGINILRTDRQLKGFLNTQSQTMAIVQPVFLPGMLLKGHKWDLRLFVLVTGMKPVRVYMFNRGIVRLASVKLGKTFDRDEMLTNTHVARKSSGKTAAANTWSFSKLRSYMVENGVDPTPLFRQLRAAVGVTFLTTEISWASKLQMNKMNRTCVSCYQLLGVDALVDENLTPRIIEVNAHPSLALNKKNNTDHYSVTKILCLHDMSALVHNTNSAASLLPELLSSAPREDVELLSNSHIEYLIKYLNERRSLGGFLPVYPSLDLVSVFDLFFHHNSQVFDSSRTALHRVLSHIETVSPVQTADF